MFKGHCFMETSFTNLFKAFSVHFILLPLLMMLGKYFVKIDPKTIFIKKLTKNVNTKTFTFTVKSLRICKNNKKIS